MKKLLLFSCVLGLGTLMSCEKDEADTTNHSTLSGSAVKGYVDGATVDVYEYTAGGERGRLIASGKTDNVGGFALSADYRGPVEIVVTEGQYADEATGSTVNLQNSELRTIAVLGQENNVAAVTSLTTIAAEYIEANASSDLEASINIANEKVAKAFGIAEVNISKDLSADLSHASSALSKAQLKYGAVQAGLSQIVMEKGLSADKLLTLVSEIGKDYADGVLDGKAGSATLETTLSITPEQALGGLNIAMENFLNSDRNKSGADYQSVDITVPVQSGR